MAICAEHPFFSYDDWFIATTTLDGGIPASEEERVFSFGYNDLDSVRALFAQHRDQIAAVFLEPARTEPPAAGFLDGLRALCTENGALLVFDEMITGFRYALHGAQDLYGVVPDLSTFGKALANGFSLSALCGKREFMRFGSRERDEDDVFLLSTTHGAETPALAAAIATIGVYEQEPVIEHLYRQGERLAAGLREAAARHGLADYVTPVGFPCNLVFNTLGPDGEPSQAYRTLFLQETGPAWRAGTVTRRQLRPHRRRRRQNDRGDRRVLCRCTPRRWSTVPISTSLVGRLVPCSGGASHRQSWTIRSIDGCGVTVESSRRLTRPEFASQTSRFWGSLRLTGRVAREYRPSLRLRRTRYLRARRCRAAYAYRRTG